jgi:hypothetical protein
MNALFLQNRQLIALLSEGIVGLISCLFMIDVYATDTKQNLRQVKT